jgi:purine catabolism regulator
MDFFHCLKDKGFTLLTGRDGLNREITTINMMENPDTLKWIKPGEFLLTTGYFMKDNEELQLEFIKQLSSINAGGIGLKKNRYISDLPQKVIEEANSVNLPIIIIPYEYSLSDVSSIFYKEVYERQSEVLRKSLNIHEQFMNIVLSGGSIEELSRELENLINNPLIIVNEYGEILANAGLDTPEYLSQELFISYNDGVTVDIDIFKKYYDSINQSFPKEAIKYPININGEEIIYRVKPIVSEREIYGYIIVCEAERKITEIDYIAIERASVIILLERMKQKAIDETKQLMRRDFFDDLLEGKIHSESDLENIAMIYGLRSRYYYSCMIVQFNNINNNVLQYYSEKKFASQFRENIFKFAEIIGVREQVKTVSIVRGTYLIIFIPFKHRESQKENKDFALSFAKAFEDMFLTKYNKYNLKIGIGKNYPILNQSKSFKEAMESIRITSQLDNERNIVHFDDFMIYHLLNSSGNTELLKEFYNNSIKLLADYDEKNNINLVNTLECYFKCKGNMSEAAKMLYIHRNTLLYRLDKIKEILKTDLENGEENLELQLGIHIMKLLSLYK